MLQDLEAGKPLEYEAFNGIVVELLRRTEKSADKPSLYGALKFWKENKNGKVAITIRDTRNHMTRLVLVLLCQCHALAFGFAQAQTAKIWSPKAVYFEVAKAAPVTVSERKPHAGRAFPIPFGTVYSTNITQDKETGLGNWTDQQIRDAMVNGISHDGSRILPVMPYEGYSGMAQEDLKALSHT
jgi:hypothetical protein